ncbi:MAG: hypothetical protein QNJ57_10195 [Flavobacteriaceae bacterium]|nr:hypothetical protein [Flavobacteriaceae bacterium]
MKSSLLKILIIFFFCFSCSQDSSTYEDNGEDNTPQAQDCDVSEIRYEALKFEYKYNEDGLFLMNEFIANNFKASYYVNRTISDSLNLGIIREDLSKDPPFITAKFNGTKVVQIKRFYPSTNANIFDFDYDNEKVRITQKYFNGNSIQSIAFGDYFLDQDGNISAVKKYKFDDINDPSSFKLTEEKSFTYDDAKNPWKGILFPIYLCQSLPKAKYLSNNNATSEIKNSETTEFLFEYDENNHVIKGFVEEINACSSPKIVEEFYSYSDCNN